MPINLLTAPSGLSFSGDFINAEFLCTDFKQQTGVNAINTISFADNTDVGVTKTIKYGDKSIVMVSAAVPDDSGLQYLSGKTAASDVLDYFNSNHQLSKDFEITAVGANLIFTAKEKQLGFNFLSGNTSPGLPDIVKPNYTVLFKLFLENATHTGFDLIFTTNLQLRFGGAGKAIAQLNDKIAQKILNDIDRLGLEVPTTSALACKTTARKYYFEYAESYGDQIKVQKLYKSDIYNVILGGLSFQAKTNSTTTQLISPGAISSDRFLKQGSTLQYTREDQPQFLAFYNTRITSAGSKLVAFHYFEDGTNGYEELYSFDLEANKKYGFNVSAGNAYTGTNILTRYDIYIIDANDERISEKQIYFVNRKLQPYARYFVNLSSWGGLDSRCTTGKAQSSLEIEYNKANRFLSKGYRLQNGNAKIFGKTSTKLFSVASGFIDKATMYFFEDIFLSKFVFRYINNTLLPIEITSKSIDFTADGDYLYAIAFEYSYLFTNDAFSENDDYDLPIIDFTPITPKPIKPIIIYAGTPANPSKNIIYQQIP